MCTEANGNGKAGLQRNMHNALTTQTKQQVLVGLQLQKMQESWTDLTSIFPSLVTQKSTGGFQGPDTIHSLLIPAGVGGCQEGGVGSRDARRHLSSEPWAGNPPPLPILIPLRVCQVCAEGGYLLLECRLGSQGSGQGLRGSITALQ